MMLEPGEQLVPPTSTLTLPSSSRMAATESELTASTPAGCRMAKRIPPHTAWSCYELISTVCPARDGLVSTVITARTPEAPFSTTGSGLTVTTMLGGSAPVAPPVPLPRPLRQVWVLWQPLATLAETTPDVPSRGRLKSTT